MKFNFIKKMDEYFEMLLEAFQNPVKINWVDKPNHLIGLFQVGTNIYQIDCLEKGNNIWKYDFYFYKDKEMSPNMTNLESDKYKVLPTVKEGLYYLHTLKTPDAVVFGALDSSRGRKKLYESFSKDFAKEKNYEFYTKVENDKQIFVIYKDYIDKEYLFETIKKVVDEKF